MVSVWRRLGNFLMAPTARLTDPVERGTARLLSACLLGMTAAFLGLDAALMQTIPGYAPPFQGYALLAVSYALSRTTRYRWGAILTTAMFPAVAVGIVAQQSVVGSGPLAYTLLAPFFAGLFLGKRGAIVFGVLSPLAIAVVPLLSPLSFYEVSNHFLANAVGGLVAVSYALHRDWVEGRRRKTDQLQEAQLIQMQKMEALGRMAGGIAHDFNNLLTVINGGVELLGRQGVGKELRLIETATNSAQTLTAQLLTLSRQRLVERGPSDLEQGLATMVRLLSRIIGEDVQVRVSVAPGTRLIALGENQLQQVLLNLATNARDAMPDGGLLEFTAKNESEHHVRLTVRDTGVGMDWETREKIFEPFFTTKSVGKGTGLGLSMVFGIVSQVGGSVEVESEPGLGAKFHLLLPCATGKSERPTVNERILSLEGHARGRVLLVEDDSGVRELCRSVLRREGFEVVEAADPEEAIALFDQRESKFDLLVTDIVMPKMSGLVLAEILRKDCPELPTLFMSGYAPDHVAGGPLDGRSVLQKPFRPTELLRRVSALLYGLDSQSPPPAEEMPTDADVIPPLRSPAFPEPGASGFHLRKGSPSESADSGLLAGPGKALDEDGAGELLNVSGSADDSVVRAQTGLSPTNPPRSATTNRSRTLEGQDQVEKSSEG